MGSLIKFPPEFYAMATAYWQVYQPMLIIWLAIVLALVVLFAFGLSVYHVIRPLLP